VVTRRGSSYDTGSISRPPGSCEITAATRHALRPGEIDADCSTTYQGALWTASMLDSARLRRACLRRNGGASFVGVYPSALGWQDDAASVRHLFAAGKGLDGGGYVLADIQPARCRPGLGRRCRIGFRRTGPIALSRNRISGGAMVEIVPSPPPMSRAGKLVTASASRSCRRTDSPRYTTSRGAPPGKLPQLEDHSVASRPRARRRDARPDSAAAMIWVR